MSSIQNLEWHKYKEKDKTKVLNMLRDLEDSCVVACDRFFSMNFPKDKAWLLHKNKEDIIALIINSRSTLIPILCGLKEIPKLKFLKSLLKKKRIHSLQGLKEDVNTAERELNKLKEPAEINDYLLMKIDHLPFDKKSISGYGNLVIRPGVLEDTDALLPLRKGYEEEEVLPKGSVFVPKAGRQTLINFISKNRLFVAELNKKIVGKIAVNAAAFTKYQIGGVYVLPEYRGKGIAARMTHEFVKKIINEGKGVTLFVKKNNIPARKLYLGLGFRECGDYKINYY